MSKERRKERKKDYEKRRLISLSLFSFFNNPQNWRYLK